MVDYSDTDDATPIKFAKMVDRVDGAIQRLDSHIDLKLSEIDKHAMDTSFHMAASADLMRNEVVKQMDTVDQAVRALTSHVRQQLEFAEHVRIRTQRKLVAVLATCFLLIATQGFEIYFETVRLGAWRTTGRDLQLRGIEMQTEILKRVRAHDGVFVPAK